ncbi:MAG: hypothetical protein HY704_17525 [Gemmatimonadetes bacterium]|nr:hypothetical protein [Gemmatimonadota bacterium]
MIVIEAVRTRCWNAITGQRRVVTVEECANELRRGDTGTRGYRGYIRVTEQDIARMTVAPLPPEGAAAFRLTYPAADGLDPGERDLLAHATTRNDDFQVCSCDKAAVVAAHALGWLDRVVSLEAVALTVGARPNPALKVQFTEARMGQWRTSLTLGGPI